jgi:hypothetical protein
MKIAKLIITYLVGFVFFVFGGMFFLHMPMPAMPGDAGVWAGIMVSSGYMAVVKVLEVVIGAMLLLNFKRTLAWLLLLPIVVNIALFEVCLAKAPGLGIVLVLLNLFMVYANKESYQGILKGK